jgi:hypothetical protein
MAGKGTFLRSAPARPPARPPAPENPRPDPAAATRDGARDYVSSPPLPSRTLNRREGPPAGWPAAASAELGGCVVQ